MPTSLRLTIPSRWREPLEQMLMLQLTSRQQGWLHLLQPEAQSQVRRRSLACLLPSCSLLACLLASFLLACLLAPLPPSLDVSTRCACPLSLHAHVCVRPSLVSRPRQVRCFLDLSSTGSQLRFLQNSLRPARAALGFIELAELQAVQLLQGSPTYCRDIPALAAASHVLELSGAAHTWLLSSNDMVGLRRWASQLRRAHQQAPLATVRTGNWPPWRRHRWPPEAPEAASEGLGAALRTREERPSRPGSTERRRGLSERGRPSRHFRRSSAPGVARTLNPMS